MEMKTVPRSRLFYFENSLTASQGAAGHRRRYCVALIGRPAASRSSDSPEIERVARDISSQTIWRSGWTVARRLGQPETWGGSNPGRIKTGTKRVSYYKCHNVPHHATSQKAEDKRVLETKNSLVAIIFTFFISDSSKATLHSSLYP